VPGVLGEIEEARDVVVLFVAGEEAFGFGRGWSKGRKADGIPKLPAREIADRLIRVAESLEPGEFFGDIGGRR